MKTLATAAAALALAAPAHAQLPDSAGEGADAQLDVTLEVVESDRHGAYLVTARGRGEDGRPVYVFETDTPAADGEPPVITCTSDECLRLWPLVSGGVTLGQGLDEELLGTTDYGDLQVALWNGWPLYHFSRDQTPETEEPQGQAMDSYGGAWYLISPSGEPIVP